VQAFIDMTEEERRRFCKEAEGKTGLAPPKKHAKSGLPAIITISGA
jgi:hypothetical protein